MHRTDRLTAAVNNLGDRELFLQHYRALLAHYGLKAQAINARQAHENGDAEPSHNRFKTAVDQALMLRGSRDFEDRAEHERFLRELMIQRNSGRTERFGEDRAELRGLPARRMDAWHRREVRVSQGSTIRIETVASLPGADSKVARQEEGESTWDPLNVSELAPNSANGLIPSLIAWAKSQPPGNDAIVSPHQVQHLLSAQPTDR
jgi:hypothetical protein